MAIFGHSCFEALRGQRSIGSSGLFKLSVLSEIKGIIVQSLGGCSSYSRVTSFILDKLLAP